jgi:hypothetical protein
MPGRSAKNSTILSKKRGFLGQKGPKTAQKQAKISRFSD